MLTEILNIIERDGYIKKDSLAKELNITVDLVEDGLAQLIRMGFLQENATGEACTTFCANCPFANNCSKEVVKAYSLTDKSRQARR